MNHVQRVLTTGLLAGLSGLFMPALQPTASAAIDGKAVFETSCSVCHSVMPPPKSAPPITPIASRYRQRFTTKAQGVNAMVSFIKAPSKAKVIADPQAVTRFGLMPAVKLSDEELKAVAGWVWDQGSTGGWGPGSGAGRGAGRGNCIRK